MALTDNLALALEFESGAIGTDATGQNTAFTNNNVVTSVSGKVGNAGNFVIASSQSLVHADTALLSCGDISFSFAAWLYVTDNSQTCTAFAKTNTQSEHFLEWSPASSAYRFRVWDAADNNTNHLLSSGGTPTNNTWYFVVVSHNATGNTLKGSVNNGTVDSASYSAGVRDSNADLYIGFNQQVGGRYWGGMIDQLLFYKRDLFDTPADITSLYNGGAGMTYAAMVGGGGGKPYHAYAQQ